MWGPLNVILTVLACEAGLVIVGEMLISWWFKQKHDENVAEMNAAAEVMKRISEAKKSREADDDD